MRRCVPVALGILSLFGGATEILGSDEEEAIRELGLTKCVIPEFPSNLRRDGVARGTASVIITRDVAGAPVDILLLESTHPEFGDAAVTAVKQWRFLPLGAGQPRVQRTEVVSFDFAMQGVVFAPAAGRTAAIDLTRRTASGPSIHLVSFDQLDHPIKAIRQVMPGFPAAMVGHVEQGWANVEFLVDEDGRVRVPIVVMESAPAFGDAALVAVANWQFEHPRENGRPVIAMTEFGIHFGPSDVPKAKRD